MGTELTTLKSHPSDVLAARLQPFEVKKALPKAEAKKQRSEHLSISEYQQLVVHLHKAIEKTEQQRAALEEENLYLAKRCRIQRKLVTYLRGVATTTANQLAACQAQVDVTRGQPISQRRTHRVMSLNGALQKISGVEAIEETIETAAPLAAIDPEDLQSIDEVESMSGWLRMPQYVANATAACGKSGLSVAKKSADNIGGRFSAISYKAIAEQGRVWLQCVQNFVQNRIRTPL